MAYVFLEITRSVNGAQHPFLCKHGFPSVFFLPFLTGGVFLALQIALKIVLVDAFFFG